MVAGMQRKSNTPRSDAGAAGPQVRRGLSPDRAFVLHLDMRARPPSHIVGRVEHITSGRVAHVTSVREFLAFVTEVLREQAACPQSKRRQGADEEEHS